MRLCVQNSLVRNTGEFQTLVTLQRRLARGALNQLHAVRIITDQAQRHSFLKTCRRHLIARYSRDASQTRTLVPSLPHPSAQSLAISRTVSFSTYVIRTRLAPTTNGSLLMEYPLRDPTALSQSLSLKLVTHCATW